MLVLAVDLDQLGRDLAQHAERGHAPADPGARAALGGDRAGEDHLAGRVPLAHLEAGLDERLGRTGADHAGIAAGPEEELERLDDEGLAGARLARERPSCPDRRRATGPR